MKNSTKIWIIAAVVLILAGGALMGFTAARRSSEANDMIVQHNVTNTYPLNAANVSNIYIDCDTAEVHFIPTDYTDARVILHEPENRKHNVRVINDTLIIDIPKKEKTNFFDFLSDTFTTFSFSAEKVTMTLYLPTEKYDSLTVNTSTGDVIVPADYSFGTITINGSTSDIQLSCHVDQDLTIETDTGDITLTKVYASKVKLTTTTGDVTADFDPAAVPSDLQVETDTGEIHLKELNCWNFGLTTSTGKVTLKGINSHGDFSIHTSTGDVNLDLCDAQSIKIETSTGDVRGTLKSDKIFFTQTSTGKVNVPKTTTGGTCEIITSTGDIEIDIR